MSSCIAAIEWMRPASLAAKSAAERLVFCVREATASHRGQNVLYAMVELRNQQALVFLSPPDLGFVALPLRKQRRQYKGEKCHDVIAA
jgi:hypothetical protein